MTSASVFLGLAIYLLAAPALPARTQAAAPLSQASYASAEEAMKHLSPVPEACLSVSRDNICVRMFLVDVSLDPKHVSWRPSRWIRQDVSGRCVDATGMEVKNCERPAVGEYRIDRRFIAL
jgi:hypothetical protein